MPSLCAIRVFVGRAQILAIATVALLAPLVRGDALTFKSTHADLGRVNTVGVLRRQFAFAVMGGQPARIVEVRASCGCLRPTVERREYAAGESGAIELAIHTASQKPGKKRFELHVGVRDPEPRTITLTADVELVSELSIEPSNLLVNLASASKLRQTVTVTDRRAIPLRITALTASSPNLQARVVPAASQAANQQAIEIEISGAIAEGKYEEKIEARTNDAQYPAFEIPVTIVRSGRLRALPDTLRVERGSSTNGPVLRQFMLLDQAGEPIKIESVTCDLAGVECKLPATPARSPRIRIAVDAAGQSQPTVVPIRVRITQPLEREIIVPLAIE